jgi:hypothetical protein
LLGAEPHRPYERPPLSKGYLQGSAAQDTVYVHPAGWYADHQIDLRLGTAVTALDRRAHEILTADGNRLRYNNRMLARVQAFLGRAHLACLVQETVKVLTMVATGVLLLVTSIWNSDRPPHHASATWTLSARTAFVGRFPAVRAMARALSTSCDEIRERRPSVDAAQ